MSELDRFDTPYQSPQLELWELIDGEWLSVIREPPYTPRCQQVSTEERQLALSLMTD